MRTPFFPGLTTAASSTPEPTSERLQVDGHVAVLRLAKQLEGVHPKVGATALCTLLCACAHQAGMSLDALQQLVADTHKKTSRG
jgi:hypothetical protein